MEIVDPLNGRPTPPGYKRRVIGADQPEYQPLPAIVHETFEQTILSGWRLSWRERLRVLVVGRVYVQLLTFGDPVQPQIVSTELPEQLR